MVSQYLLQRWHNIAATEAECVLMQYTGFHPTEDKSLLTFLKEMIRQNGETASKRYILRQQQRGCKSISNIGTETEWAGMLRQNVWWSTAGVHSRGARWQQTYLEQRVTGMLQEHL